MTVVVCPQPADTTGLGSRLASLLIPGDVVVLAGPLGSGKTLFASGVAMGLGVEEQVTSPSFVLVRRYDSGFMPLIHADVYRLSSRHEFDDLELEADEGVLVVEWGDAVESFLSRDHLRVELAVAGDGERIVSFIPCGSWIARWQKADL